MIGATWPALNVRKQNPPTAPTTIDGDEIVARRNSPFNEIVVTDDGTGMRTLHFGDDHVLQSMVKIGCPAHLELAYTRVIPSCLAYAGKIERLLVIGLGGGTLPLFFYSQFSQLTIDVVEIDPVVVDVAKNYCGFHEDARMRVHVEDGRDFIERAAGDYDVIVLDSFSNESIPPHLLTCEFLEVVRSRLAMGGIVVANVWTRTRNALFDDMLRTYRHVFEDLYILDVPDRNVKIFVALPQERPMTREEVLARTREIFKNHALPQDPTGAISGFERVASNATLNGVILRD
ncbi:MAG TPA: fused MFS/spermidine synthase [Chthoniobacteraceae bacterium]|jgi:spermidine synthase